MKITLNHCGETLIEALVSMLIIAMTTAMLTMTVATVLRSYQQAEQTPTVFNKNEAVIYPSSSVNVQIALCDTGNSIITADADGVSTTYTVKVYEQSGQNSMNGGLYYYEKFP